MTPRTPRRLARTAAAAVATLAATAATASIGTATYDELKDRGEAYFDPAAGASWRYDGDQWWSYDDPTSVEAKSTWLAAGGFGGAMWWDITGDRDNDLAGAAAETFRASSEGPVESPSVEDDRGKGKGHDKDRGKGHDKDRGGHDRDRGKGHGRG